ncbi:uncharacterized protein BXIN_2302 [Babesia sp. Xinjiang]|uniref:uncharacterized protein n=1 Tax=Babesia sp. Xinjiang TaxID=462227 RepID=UPI000A2612FD|nr:uncharacterized protein BXIN_2302 [Babesia sp. Xinjiang]ORM40768.1 hypothetical protein BXIN_2302 [Babesia sp. Xinjiang]
MNTRPCLDALMFIRRLGIPKSSAAFQRRWKLTEVVKRRADSPQLEVVERKTSLSRYEFPRNPDALLVEGSRLRQGERIYQWISIVFPAIAFTLALAIPVGLVTTFMLNGKIRWASTNMIESFSRSNTPPKRIEKLVSARDLARLVYAKTPTIILYFTPGGTDDVANRVKLHSILLKEISTLKGSPLNVFRVNVTEELHKLNPLLREEIRRSPGMLMHLVIPSEGESYVMPLLPPVSVKSFVSQLSKILDHANIKFAKEDETITQLDEKLASVKRCMFDLTIDGKLQFLEGQSLTQMELQCKKLLAMTKSPPQTS